MPKLRDAKLNMSGYALLIIIVFGKADPPSQLRCSESLIRVPSRKFLVPFPGTFDDRIKRLKLRLPTQFVFDFFG